LKLTPFGKNFLNYLCFCSIDPFCQDEYASVQYQFSVTSFSLAFSVPLLEVRVFNSEDCFEIFLIVTFKNSSEYLPLYNVVLKRFEERSINVEILNSSPFRPSTSL